MFGIRKLKRENKELKELANSLMKDIKDRDEKLDILANEPESMKGQIIKFDCRFKRQFKNAYWYGARNINAHGLGIMEVFEEPVRDAPGASKISMKLQIPAELLCSNLTPENIAGIVKRSIADKLIEILDEKDHIEIKFDPDRDDLLVGECITYLFNIKSLRKFAEGIKKGTYELR